MRPTEAVAVAASGSHTIPLGRGREINWAAIAQHAIFIVVAVAVLLPLVFLILGSFSTARLPGDFTLDQMGLRNYIKVWSDPQTYRLFANTIAYVSGATCIGIAVAATLAWLVERTNVPGKIWIYASVPMTLAMPGLLQAMAWVLLLSPRSGFVNRWLMEWLGLSAAPFNIYSLGGMAFVEGLRLVPTAFLMLVPLLRAMDPSLEEAAAASGATPFSTARKITLRLMLPGLVAVSVYQAMTALEVFEVPGVLGLPVQLHVFSTKVYVALQSIEVLPTYGEANALGILYLLVGIAASAGYWVVVRRSEKFAVVTGKGYRPRLIDLGPWRFAFVAFVTLFIVLSIVLPFLMMLYTSLVPFLQRPSWGVFSELTLRHYALAFTLPRILETYWNTALMAGVTATVVCAMSFAISLVIVRSKFWGRRVLDFLAFIPHTIPGIVSALAFLWLFLILHVFGSVWTVIVAFTVAFIAYGTRAMNAAILQVHKDLEEAAAASGAPPWRTIVRVFLPLLTPSFVGLWIWVVLLSIRLASVPLVLTEGPHNQVLAVLIWTLWDEGDIEVIGAIGTLMMVAIFLLVLLLRWIGFSRSLIQTQSS
jgi:iron(III) transport system permease protein